MLKTDNRVKRYEFLNVAKTETVSGRIQKSNRFLIFDLSNKTD